ncbi:MAG: SLBB domain-containing protein [Bacteroidota bacterium]
MNAKLRGMVLTLLVAAALPPEAEAQIRSPFPMPDLSLVRQDLKQEGALAAPPSVPLDAPVDAGLYHVGPGDVLALNIWSSSPREHILTVTPEALVLIPSAGAADLKDMTLAQAKEAIAAKARRVYPSGEITVSLLSPRKVAVQISGNVVNEGNYEMRSVERVDALIVAANAATQVQMGSQRFDQDLMVARLTGSRRRIILKRKDGTRLPVDLVRASLPGGGRSNPYLREGDMVYVPRVEPADRSVGVFHGLSNQETYEYVPGDRLSDLFRMGFGLQSPRDSSGALLTRLAGDGSSMDTISIDLMSILAGTGGDMDLRPGDRVLLRSEGDQRLNYIAAVNGEVERPGQYPITRDGTRLSDVIRQAGGFRSTAHLRGAYILRASLAPVHTPEDVAEEQLRSLRAGLTAEDSSYYLVETALRMKGELVSADFHRLFQEGDSTQDPLLRPYDQIFIPERRGTVYVFGQVAAPGHVPFIRGEDADDYIARAGGTTNDARCGDVKVIKGGTRVWLDPGETEVEEGDYIWVPKEIHRPFAQHVATYAQIASIVGVVATVALLIETMGK